jgi:hypothetical protein
MHDFIKKREALEHMQKALPAIIGNECVKVIKNNFRNEGYEGVGWAQRKDVTNKAYDYNRNKKSAEAKKGSKAKNQYKGSVYSSKSKILTQTGNLRDSIMYEVSGETVKIGVLPNSPKKDKAEVHAHTYAQHLNEGGEGKWGKYATTHTVARQFMPKPSDSPSPKMIERINKKIDSEIKTFMRDE